MRLTLAEKAFSRAAGTTVKPGQLIEISPDWAFTIDDTIGLILSYLNEKGIKRPVAPKRIALFYDHYAPANTASHAGEQALGRVFAREAGIAALHDVGTGISHQVAVEKGVVRPGQIALNTDSHTMTLGGVGCLGIGVGAAEMAFLWATGRLWFRVPETIKVILDGQLPWAVDAKDVMLYLAGRLGSLGASYCAMEYHGAAIATLPIASRMTLCNMGAELGAKCAMVPADERTRCHYEALGIQIEEEAGRPDEGAAYLGEVTVQLDQLTPMVAIPHRVDQVRPVEAVKDVHIDQAFLGTCTNGRLEDLRNAAAILRGHKVAEGVRMIVTPASREVYLAALSEGLIDVFMASGCVVTTAGCGPCAGLHMGLLGQGEVCVASSSRNFRGRMGSGLADVYLGSPATVAASAVTGKLTDPRELTQREL